MMNGVVENLYTHLFNGFSLQTGDFSIDRVIERDSRVWITADERKTNKYYTSIHGKKIPHL